MIGSFVKKFFVAGVLMSALVVALTSTKSVSALGTGDINDFNPICLGSANTFPAATTGPNLKLTATAHNWGALGSAPRYKLFYYKAATAGVVTISQTNSAPVDVDGALSKTCQTC
jgi:hypothetical protein